MDTAKLEFLRGTLDVLILKALVWGPLHGYAITSLIRRQSDDALLLEEGTLYPALWRLENKGWLDAEWGLSENNRKAKFYGLTAEGRRHGTLLALVVAKLISSLLFGTSSWDLPTYFGMALALLLVAAISGYIPARRASGVNPTQVLRSN